MGSSLSSMPNAMAERMAENQRNAMQKQMATQASMNLAAQRDNLMWLSGIYG